MRACRSGPRRLTVNSEFQHNGMVIASAIGARVLHNLACDDLDGVIGEDVVDAHPRTLILIDEIGGDRIAAPSWGNSILEPELTQSSEDLLATFDELIHRSFWVRREASERFDHLKSIDLILRAYAVEIPTYDDGPP